MSKVVFSSCKPYLQICVEGVFITFDGKCNYSPKDEEELQRLREYAERTKGSYLITEGADPTELMRKYEELEDARIKEAEARELERFEAEKQRKADHEFYSLLRMSDTVYSLR